MVLGIDSSQANRKIRSGTEWYAFNLISEMIKLLKDRTDVKIRLYVRGPLQGDLVKNFSALGGPASGWEVRILKWPLKYFWGQIRLSWEMLVNPPDVLFCPAHTIPLTSILSRKGRGRIRVFTTLHDMGFKDYPELYDKFSLWYHRFSAWWAVKKTVHIFTISEFSKDRIVANYHCEPNKITVTYLGINISSAIADEMSRISDYGLRKKNYILYVGRLEPKKNILNMVKGYETFLSLRSAAAETQSQSRAEIASGSTPRNDNAPILVLAGRKVRIDDVEEYLQGRPVLKAKVKLLNYVSEQEKWTLYKGAAVFLFATLYEGFGLPILEAQCAETPVITSNTASNPEIAGGGAVLVNPDSSYEIGQAILKIQSDVNLRQEKTRLGLENIKRFSWRETAKKTLNKIL